MNFGQSCSFCSRGDPSVALRHKEPSDTNTDRRICRRCTLDVIAKLDGRTLDIGYEPVEVTRAEIAQLKRKNDELESADNFWGILLGDLRACMACGKELDIGDEQSVIARLWCVEHDPKPVDLHCQVCGEEVPYEETTVIRNVRAFCAEHKDAATEPEPLPADGAEDAGDGATEPDPKVAQPATATIPTRGGKPGLCRKCGNHSRSNAHKEACHSSSQNDARPTNGSSAAKDADAAPDVANTKPSTPTSDPHGANDS